MNIIDRIKECNDIEDLKILYFKVIQEQIDREQRLHEIEESINKLYEEAKNIRSFDINQPSTVLFEIGKRMVGLK